MKTFHCHQEQIFFQNYFIFVNLNLLLRKLFMLALAKQCKPVINVIYAYHMKNLISKKCKVKCGESVVLLLLCFPLIYTDFYKGIGGVQFT